VSEMQALSAAAPLAVGAFPGQPVRTIHVAGIDALRIICAVWVVLSHAGGLPIADFLARLGTSVPIVKFVASVNAVAFDGVAAVMVFYVVSGLCIHLPVTSMNQLDPVKFWIRRVFRVGAPLIVAIVLSKVLMGRSSMLAPVLWSLYSELIYYAIYPALLRVASTVGWRLVFAGSVFTSALTVILVPNKDGFVWGYGISLTWLYGLPVWILGVLLAEVIPAGAPALSRIQLTGLRLAVWLASSLATALHFHSSLRYSLSMLLFSPLAFYWVLQEIRAARERGTSKILETCGQASYSVYLCHMIVLAGFSLSPRIRIGQFLEAWLACAAFCTGFYLCIESPSHSLARALAGRIPARLWMRKMPDIIAHKTNAVVSAK